MFDSNHVRFALEVERPISDYNIHVYIAVVGYDCFERLFNRTCNNITSATYIWDGEGWVG